jgi:hypothetical protein
MSEFTRDLAKLHDEYEAEKLKRTQAYLAKQDPSQRGAYDSITGVSQMAPGEMGWLSLDDQGVPQGVYAFPPDPGAVPACAVMKSFVATGDQLVTASGGPVTDTMNARPDMRLPEVPAGSSLARATAEKSSTPQTTKKG